VDVTDIEQLIDLMRRSGVMHLSLEQPTYKITITRGAEPLVAASPSPAPTAAPAPPPEAPGPVVPPAAAAVKVTSPVVGVLRGGGALPAVGARVKPGQVLAVVEAMKVPNEIVSPVEGTVSDVLVREGSPVEYGQTLFLILAEGGGTDEDETPVGLA